MSGKGGLKMKAEGEAEKDDGRAGKGETQSLDGEYLRGQRCFGGLLYDVSDQDDGPRDRRKPGNSK